MGLRVAEEVGSARGTVLILLVLAPLCPQRRHQQPQAGGRAAGSRAWEPPAPQADPAAGGHVLLQRGGASRAGTGQGQRRGGKEAEGGGGRGQTGRGPGA